MELIERIPLREINYLQTFTLADIKKFYPSCKNDEARRKQLDNLKSFCATNVKTSGQTTRIYSYSLSTPLSSGGRLYCGNAVQGLSKAVRGLLMKHTTDIDMKNAHPVILKYVCNKHHIRCPMLTEYVLNRDSILATFADRDAGKKIYLSAINDNELNSKIKDKQFKLFDNEMKDIQTQIASLPEYQNIKSSVPSEKRINWNGSHLNRVLCMYENLILQSCISALNKRSIEIQALMFDGLMVTGNYYNDPDLLDYIANEVENNFNGLNMVWDYKPHSDLIQMPADFVEVDNTQERLYAQNDLEACKMVYKMIKDDIVFCKSVLYFKQDHIWINEERVIFEILVSYIQNLKIYMKTEKNDVEYSHKYKSARDIAHSLIGEVKSNMDNDWVRRAQYSSLGKILFTNGYYNRHTQKFYAFDAPDFDKSIVFTGRTHIDFPETFDVEYMDSIKERLFYQTLGKAAGDYMILNLARGLMGDMAKQIIIGLGGTNTGKSVLTDAIANSFGDYFGSFNAENLAYRNSSTDEAANMRWAMLLKNKRIIVSNEVKTNVELNGNMMKKLSSGGDTLIGRNHCACEEEFIMQPLTVILANDIPKIKPCDDALEKRLGVVSYTKQYVAEPSNELELKMDDGVKDEVKTLKFKQAFIGLLLYDYTLMQENGIPPVPAEVLKAKIDWVCNDKGFIDDFKNDFELTNDEDDYVTSKRIEEWIKANNLGITAKKFGMEMQKHKIIHKLDVIKSGGKKINGKNVQVWFGVKEIMEVMDVNEGL